MIIWQNCFLTRQYVIVKSLMKTLRLHIIVIEPDQFIHHKWISRMNAIVDKQCLHVVIA